jgi:hypothetical protein
MIPTRPLMDSWRDSLIVELRLRDVPGERIGEALAEVDAHCADSGQTPEEAFGDPVTYAASLISAYTPAPAKPRPVRAAGLALVGLTGVFGVLNGVDAVADGGPGTLSAGELACAVAGAVLMPVIARVLFTPALFRRTGAWIAVAVAVPLVIGVPTALWRDPVVTLPAWVMLIGGLALLAPAWWPFASGRLPDDRIIDPRTGAEPFATPVLARVVIRWSFPLMVLAAVLLEVLIP